METTFDPQLRSVSCSLYVDTLMMSDWKLAINRAFIEAIDKHVMANPDIRVIRVTVTLCPEGV